MQITDIKEKDDVYAFLFYKMKEIGMINSKLSRFDVKLKVLKLILPRTIEDGYVNSDLKERLQYMIKKAGVLLEFKGEPEEVLYQLHSTELLMLPEFGDLEPNKEFSSQL